MAIDVRLSRELAIDCLLIQYQQVLHTTAIWHEPLARPITFTRYERLEVEQQPCQCSGCREFRASAQQVRARLEAMSEQEFDHMLGMMEDGGGDDAEEHF